MVSPENSNWLFDYPLIDDDITVGDGSFTVSAFSWPPPPSNVRYSFIPLIRVSVSISDP